MTFLAENVRTNVQPGTTFYLKFLLFLIFKVSITFDIKYCKLHEIAIMTIQEYFNLQLTLCWSHSLSGYIGPYTTFFVMYVRYSSKHKPLGGMERKYSVTTNVDGESWESTCDQVNSKNTCCPKFSLNICRTWIRHRGWLSSYTEGRIFKINPAKVIQNNLTIESLCSTKITF